MIVAKSRRFSRGDSVLIILKDNQALRGVIERVTPEKVRITEKNMCSRCIYANAIKLISKY